jgi:peptidyl-prolyl cis-trans isomerase B (cyclophilin B)
MALARLGVRDAIPWLAQLLRSDDQQVRHAGAVALNHLRAELGEEISRSFVNLTRDRNAAVRVAVTHGLARGKPASATLGALVHLLADRDAKARIEALRSLGELQQPAAFRAMISGLGDPNENVRAAAAEAIGRLGNHEALVFLRSSRFEPSLVSFRAEVAAARLARGDAEYFDGLGEEVPAGYRSTPGIRAFSSALARFGSGRAIGRLESLWRSSESYVSPVRGEILRLLAEARPEAASALLDEALGDPNPQVRAAGLELSQDPPVDAADRLFREALRDGDAALQTRALDAAARAAGREAAKALLLEALASESRRVRTRAVKHLREVFSEDHFERIGPAETARSDSDYQSLARSGRAPLRLETSAGTLAMSIDYRDAPLTADHFYRLAESGYFDGREFGEVVPNAEAWFGAASAGGQDYLLESIRPEINLEPFLRGSLGFVAAERGDGNGGFFISLVPQPLKNSRYTNFGRLTSGDDVLDRITAGTKILRLRPLR